MLAPDSDAPKEARRYVDPTNTLNTLEDLNQKLGMRIPGEILPDVSDAERNKDAT
jgi:hypothetical protein